ncbi:MAG: hypothetical protein V3U11_13720 [Planctomycetota bacterium]
MSMTCSVLLALTACQIGPPDPDRDYDPPAGGVSRQAYRTLKQMRGKVFLHRRDDSLTGFLRLIRVQRAASSLLVKNGSRDDVVVTFRPTRFLGATLDSETDASLLFALLKNDADAAHLCFYASGEWPRKLASGELSPEYAEFWGKPKLAKTKTEGKKPTKPAGIWR